MANVFPNMGTLSPQFNRHPVSRIVRVLAVFLFCLFCARSSAAQQEQLLFPATDNALALLVQKIQAETVRLDVATWYLNDGDLALAILNKHRSGVPVRLIGDRGAIFEADPNTRAWFEYLANNGVPIRLRYHPTWFPFIMHWKCGIFVGQNTVEFGSANWTTFELAPWSATNFKDETALFSSDSVLVRNFLTKFDQMWADTENFLDWPDAYRTETGQPWNAPMTINRARLEPDYPNAPGMVWSQGPDLTDALLYEINRETQAIDLIVYRLTIPAITDALIAKRQAGVPIRVFVEQTQYRNLLYPEYELTGANIDRLWAAGIPVKQRQHEGLMHMKTLITSNTALNGSSNFTKNWERDHNYFISPTSKPLLYQALKNRFNAMWNDTTNYAVFQPQNPAPAPLLTPAYSSFDVSTTVTLQWKRAQWATSYDIYLGTSSGSQPLVGHVDAVMTESPPATYSFTPSQPLLPNTTYYWKVVSRTYATDVNPARIATSEFWAFTTGSGPSGGTGSGPFGSQPLALPGTMQAENFDNGGANVAFFDTTSGNSGGQFRNTDVDVETTTDTGGGFNVGWIAPGEWLKYSVNVGTAGAYTLEFRVAGAGGGGTLHVEGLGGTNLTGPVQIPDTGGWQNWTTVTKPNVNLTAGPQVWTVVFDGAIGNLNYIRVSSSGSPPPPPPPPTATPLPGTLQAEAFDEGASGVAYLDNSPGNDGGQFRATGVDIEATSDAGGGYNVGWAFAGEWLKYTVNVGAAGTYDIEARVASAGAGGTFHIEVNGVDRTGPFTVPNTGGWQTWVTIRKTGLALAAGQQTWRLVMDTNGATTAVGNFNYIRVTASGSGGVTPPPVPEVVIYGSDVPAANLRGNWARVSDTTAAGGIKIASADRAGATVGTPLAAPVDYFDVTFNAQAGVRYRLWLRMSAAAGNKFNDSIWVQFSGSNDSAGAPRYRIGTAQALNVNLATCSDCVPAGWGWQNRAYWEIDTGEVWFATTGAQTIRIQIREDGAAIDQIVVSPGRFVDGAPGPPTLDTTIVPKS